MFFSASIYFFSVATSFITRSSTTATTTPNKTLDPGFESRWFLPVGSSREGKIPSLKIVYMGENLPDITPHDTALSITGFFVYCVKSDV